MQLLLYAYCTDREGTAVCEIAFKVRTLSYNNCPDAWHAVFSQTPSLLNFIPQLKYDLEVFDVLLGDSTK